MSAPRRVLFGAVAAALTLVGSACGSTSVQPGSGSGSTTSTSMMGGTSGVAGTVTASPTCPVERIDDPCPPHPVSAPIDLQDAQAKTVASTTSAADGTYALSAPPGEYTLIVVTNVFPRCPPTPVTIVSDHVTTADISCDSGIR